MKNVVRMVCAVALAGAMSANGAEASKTTPLQQTLAAVPAAELPAKAAELVKTTRARDRGFVTVDVVRAAVGINNPAAPAIVGAVARAVPDTASIAAGTAAEMLPKQAAAIAKAAAAAAPSKAGRIVAAVCRIAPKEYREVALAASQTAPTASTEILRAVASVFPDLKPGIDQATRGYSGNPTTVALVLDTTRPANQLNVHSPMILPSHGSGALISGGVTPVVSGPSIAAPSMVSPDTPANRAPTDAYSHRNYAEP